MLHSSKKALFAALLFLLAIAGGCTEKDPLAENNLQFETIDKEETYHMFDSPDNPSCSLVVKFTYPNRFDDETMLANLQEKFVTSAFGPESAGMSVQEAVDKYAADYIKMYKEIEPDYKEEIESNNNEDANFATWYAYFQGLSTDIVFNRAQIVSFTHKFEAYSGGAHGSQQYSNYVIDLNTGNWIKEGDIFIDDFKDDIARLLIDKIMELNQADNVQALIDLGFFGIEEIMPNDNILIDEKGVTYLFNEYEIAAYALGTTKVLLPFDEISLYLKKESPIAHLFNN